MQEYQEQTASVYGLKDQRVDEIFYIGMSIDPQRRYEQHLSLRSNPEKSTRILDMSKDGLVPELVIFESGLSISYAFKRESYWIQYHRSIGAKLTNRTAAGSVTFSCASRSPVNSKISTIEDACTAGMDTSRYLFIDDQWWLLASDAASLISYINSYSVDTGYLNNPVKQGRLNPLRISPKCSFYPFDELVNIKVQKAGRPMLPDDQVTDSAIRQRRFKARRRAERLAQAQLSASIPVQQARIDPSQLTQGILF